MGKRPRKQWLSCRQRAGGGAGAAGLGGGLAEFEGGHGDVVRAVAPGSAPVTGAEDARVCVWGEWAAAAAGESSGGKAAREGSESGGSRRQSPY